MSVRNFLSLSLAVLALSACASKAPPATSSDATSLRPAVEHHDPASLQNVVMSTPIGVSGKIDPPARRRPELRVPTARVAVANRAALHEPSSSGYINAVQIYPFSDNALYRLYAAPQQVSDIVLQPGETLSAVSAGDTVRWAVGDTASGSGPSRQVHVMVKPFATGLKTNLVILTDRRTYHLELVSTDRTSMAAISWSYPQDGLIAEHGSGQSSATIDSGLAIENLNFRYAISGDSPAWRPVRAFDDGNKVYIEFPERIDQGEAPPLFVVGEDGRSDLVNYRVRGNFYVVDRLFAAAELRLGSDKQQVVRISRTAQSHHGLAAIFGG